MSFQISKRPAALAAALALAIPGALTVTTIPAPAAAQTCRVAPNNGGAWWTSGVYYHLGEVFTWTDLKIRVAAADRDSGTAVLDIKTPDFTALGIRFTDRSTYKFNACGAEITVTFQQNTDGVISIGVF